MLLSRDSEMRDFCRYFSVIIAASAGIVAPHWRSRLSMTPARMRVAALVVR